MQVHLHNWGKAVSDATCPHCLILPGAVVVTSPSVLTPKGDTDIETDSTTFTPKLKWWMLLKFVKEMQERDNREFRRAQAEDREREERRDTEAAEKEERCHQEALEREERRDRETAQREERRDRETAEREQRLFDEMRDREVAAREEHFLAILGKLLDK